MDTLAALAFGREPAIDRYLEHAPIARNASLITSRMFQAIGSSSLYITVFCVGILINAFNIDKLLTLHGNEEMLTFMFTVFIFSIIANSLNTRSDGFNLFEKITENHRFIWIMGTLAVAQAFIIQFGGQVFGTVPMSIEHFLYAAIIGLFIIPFDMLRKAITGAYK